MEQRPTRARGSKRPPQERKWRSNQMGQPVRELAYWSDPAGLGAPPPVAKLPQQLLSRRAGSTPKLAQFLSHRIGGVEELHLAHRRIESDRPARFPIPCVQPQPAQQGSGRARVNPLSTRGSGRLFEPPDLLPACVLD